MGSKWFVDEKGWVLGLPMLFYLGWQQHPHCVPASGIIISRIRSAWANKGLGSRLGK